MKRYISILAVLVITISAAFSFSACEGLKTLDLFDLITVEFSGLNGKGSVSFENNDTVFGKDWHSLIKLVTENNGQLSNGDEITINMRNISGTDIGGELEQMGYKVKGDRIQKKFVVKGLPEKINKSNITEDVIEEVKQCAAEQINASDIVIDETVMYFGEARNSDAEHKNVLLVAMDYTKNGFESYEPQLREELSSDAAFVAFYDCHIAENGKDMQWKKVSVYKPTTWSYESKLFKDETWEKIMDLQEYKLETIDGKRGM